MVKATKAAESMPINETTEIVYSAGCLAKINTPTPKMVVITDRIIEVLCVGKAFSPMRYSISSPLVTKIQ